MNSVKTIKRINTGFTLIELLIVISIIGLLVAVILASLTVAQSRGRDAQVRADKQLIVLALVRAREADPNVLYPGSSGAEWQCLKASGTCWNGQYQGNPDLVNALAPYLPNGIPMPPGAVPGQFRYDSYLYSPNTTVNGVTGAYLIWPQEKPLLSGDCKGYNAGDLPIGGGVYYCKELLPR